jgi:hypothetical protein
VSGNLLQVTNTKQEIKPFFGEIKLKGFPTGFYELLVTIKDETKNTTLIKAVFFQIV